MQTQVRNYGTLISELQERLGLTQTELAHKIGVKYLAVNRWKNGHHQPSPMAIAQLKQIVIDLGDRGKDLHQAYFN